MAPEETRAPFVSVVRGNPDSDELAALTAVLLAVLRRAGRRREQAGDRADEARGPLAAWSPPAQPHGASWRRGPTAPPR